MLALIKELESKRIKVSLKENNLEISFDGELDKDMLVMLKSNKEKLIQFLTKHSNATKGIKNIGISQSYRISHAQKRLWLLSQIEKNSKSYHISNQLELNEDIDIPIFEESILKLIQRHEILRTVFKLSEDGEVRQWIINKDELKFKSKIIDFQNETNPYEKIRKYIHDDNEIAFDLESGPLLRIAFFKLKENKCIFYYNMHHIITDGWSLNVLEKDLFAYYQSVKNNTVCDLEDLKIQYKDYAAWQLDQLENGSLKTSKQYWSTKLKGELPIIDLPSNLIRPPIKTNNGHSLSSSISPNLTRRLRDLTQEAGGSLFMGLLATLKTLIFRYTLQEDIVIGTAVAGRDHADFENQIGFYVNTLILRNSLSPGNTFKETLIQAKESTIEAYNHQIYPFDKLIEDLDLKKDLSRNPLFELMLTFQNNLSGQNKKQSIDPDTIVDLGPQSAKFDLSVTFEEVGEGLSFIVAFNKDVYELSMMSQLIKHFKQLLNVVLETPDIKISDIDYLTDQEKQKLLVDFNNTAVDYTNASNLIDLFVEQAKKTPDTIALIFENVQLSYKQLDELSNQLAHCLIKNHVINKGDLIGIHLDRSELFIVSILGILKTGGAYVPIDTSYPATRKKYILEDSTIKMLITTSNYIEGMDDYKHVFLAIDTMFNARDFSSQSLEIKLLPEDLAYCIYTSGSTGVPKGVLIQHKSIVNTILSQMDLFNLKNCKRSLQFASFSFDASISEIFITLLSGSSLYVINEDTRKDLKLLEAYILENEIDILTLPPAYLKLIDIQYLKKLKVLITAGESPICDKVKSYLAYGGIYLNAYGPTETSICASVFKMNHDVASVPNPIPIGNSISNVQLYILNDFMNLQPIGVIGEIYIGGSGLSKGYQNLPVLTSEKFIQNPFKKEERLYKTGDIGKWSFEGNIEFIGRKDDQIKINGNRIELGEITAQLLTKKDIENAYVLINKTSELVAYIASPVKQKVTNLRKFLSERLPLYMLPTFYVQIDHIPLTVNQKVDENQLLKLVGESLPSEVEFIEANDETESKIINIWQRLLNVETISMNADFFILGGQSIKATSLINEYQKSFHVKLSFKDILEKTTVESHSLLIKSATKKLFVGIKTIESKENYQLSYGQRRLWVLSQFNDASEAYNLPNLLTIQINDRARFTEALFVVINRHEILRTVFRKNEQGEVCQYILSVEESKFKLEYLDFRKEKFPVQKGENYVASDSYIPFDLEHGPLLRASLIQIDVDTYIFYYNMHHIISDAWSIEVVAKEVMHYYEVFRNNGSLELPPLTIQYKDYAAWQITQLEDNSLLSSKNYWTKELNGELSIIDLPSKKVRPRVKTYNGHSLSIRIPAQLTKGIRVLSRKEGGSLFMGLLTTLKALIYHYTSQQDIIIGTPVAGREHADLEGQIGFYLNTLVLRDHLSSEKTFKETLHQIIEHTAEAYTHQMYPFDKLVEDLNLPRDVSRNTLFEVMMTLQNVGDSHQKTQLNDSDEIKDLGSCKTKFDLTLSFEETGDSLSFIVAYNTDVYENSMVSRFMIHFKELLIYVVNNPDVKIKEIEYLSELEKNMLLNGFNDTYKPYPTDKTLIDLFEEQVAKTPNRIAVESENIKLTYKTLNELSNQLAHCLNKTYDISKGDLVGMQLIKNEWVLVSILGILKAGAAYIPIDTELTEKRKQFIIEDTRLKLLITNEAFVSVFKDNGYITLSIDGEFKSSDFSSDKLNVNIESKDISYIIYTSGTTGQPKGVMIEHASLANYVTWGRSFYLSEDVFNKNFGLFTSLSFDLTVTSLFLPIISGGSLQLFAENKSISEVLEEYFKSDISCIKLTPSHISILPHLKLTSTKVSMVVVGGEELRQNHIKILKELNPSIRIYNEYGPTEATVGCTIFEARSIEDDIFIGKPIANSSILILNEFQQLQAQGLVGEIYIGGSGLARGYLNRSNLTNEKFIQHPFNKVERLYKTGDLGRWLQDGNIEFLGRKDRQVKIRGYRLELGEIETLIKEKQGINEVAINVVENKGGEKELIAYLIADEMVYAKDLREHLLKSLPYYMLPASYVQLASFPLTVNGKIDFEKLTADSKKSITSGVDYAAPTNDYEKELVGLLSKALNQDFDKIGIHDNFFDLGMNSIKMINVLDAFNKKFLLNIRPIVLFEFTTVSDFVANISSDKKVFELKEEQTSEALNDVIDIFS